jgi:hypothetical protein
MKTLSRISSLSGESTTTQTDGLTYNDDVAPTENRKEQLEGTNSGIIDDCEQGFTHGCRDTVVTGSE